MDHARPHETLQPNKSSVSRHREQHTEESGGDKRPSEGSVKPATEDESRPFRRVRSLSRPRAWPSHSFKPRGRGGFGFLKDDRPFRKTGFGFQRFHPHFGPRPHFPHYDHPDPKMTLAQRERERERRRTAKEKAQQRENVDISSTLGPLFPRSSSSREKDKLPFSFNENKGSQSRGPHGKDGDRKGAYSKDGYRKGAYSKDGDHKGAYSKDGDHKGAYSKDGYRKGAYSKDGDYKGAQSREGDRGRGRYLPSSVSRPEARNRAIQLKRKEIEKIYHRDCDMFGAVVKMLICKDPSLEQPIQSSLQDNLRVIGMRCVAAMQQFIEEYDAREVAQTKAQTQTKAQAQTQTQAQAQTQTQAQTQVQAQTQTQTQVQAQAHAQAQAQAQTQVQAQAQAHAQTQAQAQVQAHAQTQVQTQAQTQAHAQIQVQTQAQTQTQAHAQIQVQTQAHAQIQVQVHTHAPS